MGRPQHVVYKPSPSLGEGLVVPFVTFYLNKLHPFPSILSLTSQPKSHSCSWFNHKITCFYTISTNDYEVAHANGRESAGADGQAVVDENVNPFTNIDGAKLNIPE
ncbi:hypothetical protein Tco_0074804 [Tanacetum coccineum]